MAYISVKSFYDTTFNLMQHHKYSLEDIYNFMPWEREVYVGMLVKHLKEERENLEKQKK